MRLAVGTRVALVTALIGAGVATNALAQTATPDFTDQEIADGIVPIDPVTNPIDLVTEPFETETNEGSEKVLRLRSDILFAFGKAEISDRAQSRIEELIKDVPDGAAVRIEGHTDSIGDDASNNKLSRRRADAVAGVVQGTRSDLKLKVRGYGESKPVEPNEQGGEDNPEGRAKNRRVEIRYRNKGG